MAPRARRTRPGTHSPLGTDVLGHGGYGLVMGNATRADVAHKLIKRGTDCEDARREFDMHRRIFATYRAFVAAHPDLRASIAVPEPLRFSACRSGGCAGRECYPCGPPFHCMYSMARVRSGRADGLARHVLLNADAASYGGKIYFVNKAIPAASNATYVNAEMRRHAQPRGAYLGIPQLRAAGRDVRELARRMGMLHRLIEVAGYAPADVEYVLGMPPGARRKSSLDLAGCLWAMDFGLAGSPEYDPELELSLPQPGQPEYLHFVEGAAVVTAWARGRPGGSRAAS